MNRIVDLETNSPLLKHISPEFLHRKSSEKGTLLNKWYWNTCKAIHENMKFNIYFMLHIKTNSKGIIDF
jgi:hypothetical protein